MWADDGENFELGLSELRLGGVGRTNLAEAWIHQNLEELRLPSLEASASFISRRNLSTPLQRSSYFSERQMSIVISGNIFQFLEIERDDFWVQRYELLLLDIISGLVWNDGDFCREIFLTSHAICKVSLVILKRKSLTVSATVSICKFSQSSLPTSPRDLARKRQQASDWFTRFPSTCKHGIWFIGMPW